MLRRGNPAALLLAAGAVGALFVPIAAASASTTLVQSLAVASTVGAISLTTLAWIAIARRRSRSAIVLALAAAIGSLVLGLSVIAGASGDREELVSRVVVYAVLDAAGLGLLAWTLQRALPRRQRPLTVAAIAMVALSLYPAPLLLLQPSARSLRMQAVDLQLTAGYLYWTVGAVLLVAPFVAMATLPGDWFERWWRDAVRTVMAIPERVFIGAFVAVAVAIALGLSIYSFDRRPTTADEIAQLWHARMLLSGRLAMPPDPNPEFFAIDNVIDRPVWMSQFPIGGPLVLAMGVVLGLPWLLNPVLTALIAFNVYRFAQRAFGEAQARVAVAIVIASPMLMLMGGSQMNHTATAWLATIALAQLPVWDRRDATITRSAALIGLSTGAALTIRPLDGVVVALVIGTFMLWRSRGDPPRARSLLAAIGAGVAPVALLLFANWRTTGSPTRFGYEMLWGPNHSIGLHDDPLGYPHTAWRAMMLAVKYTAQLNWLLTSWPVPVLLVVAVGYVLARRATRWDALLIALFAGQLFAYSLYWHDGQFIGPRFLFTAIPAVLILAARAPFLAAERFRAGALWRVAVLMVPVCIGVAWLRPMRPFGVQGLAHEFRESRSRLKIDPPTEITSGRVSNALVFVQEGSSARLLHRIWGIGVSRADAARLLGEADACSLLEAVRAEEHNPGDSARRVARIRSRIVPFRESPRNPRLPDAGFHVNDTLSVTPACGREIARDLRVKNTVAYGPMLLLNRFDGSGHIAGDAVYVMDLGERNDVLRKRFGDRRWFRFELPRGQAGDIPILTPYTDR